MSKLKLLDLYCCAGGASAGYVRAGFDVVGIDNKHQKNYPYNFIQSDALEYVKENWMHYDAIHASPPCQLYSVSTAPFKKNGKTYVDLAQETVKTLSSIPLPSIIENVLAAPIRADIVLKGTMFGLKVLKKRKFQLINWFCFNPYPGQTIGSVLQGDFVTTFGKAHAKKGQKPKFAMKTIRETWSYAMGIDHYMTDQEISEAIPPAYTEYLGKLLYEYIDRINNQL